MYPKAAKTLIKALLRRQVEIGKRFSIELVGPPGVGKSQMIVQCAEELTKSWKKPVGTKPFFLSTVEAPDVRGFPLPGKLDDGTPTMSFTKAPWLPTTDDPQYGILFLDEFRQATHDVQKPAAELLLNGRVGESQLPIGWMVVAASNREEDRSGVMRELAFITNRRIVVEVEPNADDWVEWAEKNDIHWIVTAFAKKRPGLVFSGEVPEKPGPFISPRTLTQMSYLVDELPQDLFLPAAAGLIGEGAAAEFAAFQRVVDELPDWDEIKKKPQSAKVPDTDRPDAQYAAMQMVASMVDHTSADAALKYLRRLPQEFQVAGIRSALRRTPALASVKEFQDWLMKNKDLLINANLV